MTKYEKIILTYYNPDYPNDESHLIVRHFKNATFMFDSNYTSVVSKRDNFTIRTDSVVTIECKESLDD